MKKIYIFLIVIIIILIILFKYFFSNDAEHFISYENIKKNIKTGDIILFACDHRMNPIKKIKYGCRTKLLGSEFGHVGLILKKKDKYYVVECCGTDQCGDEISYHLNNKKSGGVRIIDLEEYLSEYKNSYNGYFAIKHIHKAIPNDLFLLNLKKYKNKIFESKLKLINLATLDILGGHSLALKLEKQLRNPNQMMCSEFMHSILFDCGILSEYNSKLFWPHMINDSSFCKFQIVPYGKIIHFRF